MPTIFFKALAAAALLGVVAAQRPESVSICDYYTTALLKSNTAANQQTLLTLMVNAAMIGNYTAPNVGISVGGFLYPGEINGTSVNLAGYFNGSFGSTNRGGSSGIAVDFLDGGGPVSLRNNEPASDSTSNQYNLLTHLYEYFGEILGCSLQGQSGFAAYGGSNSMYEVHKFMALDSAQVGYFILQVTLSMASFGVVAADTQIVGLALGKLFDYRCLPASVIVTGQTAALQSICIVDDCPLSESSDSSCSGYGPVVLPAVVNGNSSSTGTPTGTTTSSQNSGSSSASTSVSTSSNSSTASNGRSDGLSTGAAVGIGVGATIGGLVVIGGLAWLIWRRRVSQKTAKNPSSIVSAATEKPELLGKPVVATRSEVAGDGMAHEVEGSENISHRGVHELHE